MTLGQDSHTTDQYNLRYPQTHYGTSENRASSFLNAHNQLLLRSACLEIRDCLGQCFPAHARVHLTLDWSDCSISDMGLQEWNHYGRLACDVFAQDIVSPELAGRDAVFLHGRRSLEFGAKRPLVVLSLGTSTESRGDNLRIVGSAKVLFRGSRVLERLERDAVAHPARIKDEAKIPARDGLNLGGLVGDWGAVVKCRISAALQGDLYCYELMGEV